MDSDGDHTDRGVDLVVAVVVAIVAVGLVARVVALGSRPLHWDEGRVGYWTLRYVATGAFEYRPVAGGPLLYILGGHVLSVLPATDFTARLVVALIGGLLPLTALLFRTRLDDLETGTLALFLALNPILLYYSRFLRGDLPLAAFAFATVGCVLYAHDTGDRRGLYAGAVTFGLAVAASGFVVGYIACWLLAAAVTFDHHRLFGETDRAHATLSRGVQTLRTAVTPLARASLVVAAVVFYFYAPRAGSSGGAGIWRLGTYPAPIEGAFVDAVRKFVGVRVLGRRQATHELIPYVTDTVGVLLAATLTLVVLAVAAFLRDRYRPGGPRPVVAFHAYWAGVGLLVFPIATEVNAPWVALHVALPLVVPAAVGAAALVRFGSRSYARGDAASVAAAVLLIGALGTSVGVVVADDVYGPASPSNSLVGYAQPIDDLDPMVASVSRAVDGHDGTAVLYYGERLDGGPDPVAPPARDDWGNRLPLPWYFERLDARTDSVASPAELDALAEQGALPPVVVADADDRRTVGSRLDGYVDTEYHLALWNREVVIFVRT